MVAGDATKLLKDWNVKLPGVCDVGHMAHEKGLSATKQVSLQELCCTLLRVNLPKNHAVRLSAWSRRPLTKQQEEYAALDAYATAEVYRAARQVTTVYDMKKLLLEECKEGLHVILLAKSGGKAVARGRVLEPGKRKQRRVWATNKETKKKIVVCESRAIVEIIPPLLISGATLLFADDHGNKTIEDVMKPISGSKTVLWSISRMRHPPGPEQEGDGEEDDRDEEDSTSEGDQGACDDPDGWMEGLAGDREVARMVSGGEYFPDDYLEEDDDDEEEEAEGGGATSLSTCRQRATMVQLGASHGAQRGTVSTSSWTPCTA